VGDHPPPPESVKVGGTPFAVPVHFPIFPVESPTEMLCRMRPGDRGYPPPMIFSSGGHPPPLVSVKVGGTVPPMCDVK
jgi:hypothetical protein